jgi:hypothetical protein
MPLTLDNTTNDLSGNSYNVQSGTVSFSTDGKKGTHSASFNGSSNYLQYSNGSFKPSHQFFPTQCG